MRSFPSLADLLSALLDIPSNEWVYVDLHGWKTQPQSCVFYVIPEEEVDALPDEDVYLSEAGPYLPVSLQALNLYPWMALPTLLGVVQHLPAQADLARTVEAINHYREYDDFMVCIGGLNSA